MKEFSTTIGLVLFTGLIYTNALATGPSSGSGADQADLEKTSAWFLNKDGQYEKEIHYCIQYADDFGYPLSKAQIDIQKAFETWTNYLFDKNVNLRNGPRPFAYNFLLDDQCELHTDVTFYLGVDDMRVKDALKRFNSPVAFVNKDQYDYKQLWSRGFIWFSKENVYNNASNHSRYPNWNDKDNFLAIALHEIGHLFGIDHVDGTIMRHDIGTFVADSIPMGERFENSFKSKIDHQRELVRRESQNMGQDSAYQLTRVNDSALSDFFTVVAGRIPVGNMSVEYHPGHMYLLMRDDVGEVSVSVAMTSSSRHRSSTHLFKQAYAPGYYYFKEHFAEIEFGHIQYELEGTSNNLPIVIEYNLNDYPVIISTMEQGWKSPVLYLDSKY